MVVFPFYIPLGKDWLRSYRLDLWALLLPWSIIVGGACLISENPWDLTLSYFFIWLMGAGLICYLSSQVEQEERAHLRAESALIDTEAKFRTLVEQAITGIYIIQDGKMAYVNPKFCQMSGYAADEILALPSVLDLVFPEDRPLVAAKIKERLEGDLPEAHYSFRGQKKDGRLVDLEAHGIRTTIDGKPAIVGTLIDVTQVSQLMRSLEEAQKFLEKRVEERTLELLRSNDRLSREIAEHRRTAENLRIAEVRVRALFHNMPSGVAVYRAVDDGRDFTFLDVNQAAERIDGIAAAQVIGRSVLEVFPGAREFGLVAVLQRVWRSGQPEFFPLACYQDERISGWRENYVYKLPSGEIVAIYDDVTSRVEQEKVLRENEERLQLVLEGSNDGFWDFDVNSGRIEYSRRLTEMLGYYPDEIVPHRTAWRALIHPEDHGLVLEALNRHLAAEIPLFEAELRVLTKSGAWKWIWVRGKVVIRDDGGRPQRVAGIVTDISDRKGTETELHRLSEELERRVRDRTAELAVRNVQLQEEIEERHRAEQALQEHFHLLQTLIDTLPHPIFYKDIQGHYLGCNTAFESLAGLARQEIIGKKSEDIWLPEFAAASREREVLLLQSPGCQTYETTFARPDGTRRDFLVSKATFSLVNGSTAGLVGVAMDITARKHAEAERLRLAAVIEQSNDGVIITDPQGLIQYVNPAFERLRGCRREDVQGKAVCSVCSYEGRRSADNIWKVILRGETFSGRVRVHCQNGRLLELDVKISPLRDEADKIISFLGVEQDVTQAVQMEQQLRQAQKLQAIGTLAGGIAHDFNNILFPIIVDSDMALIEMSPDSPLRDKLDRIHRASLRASQLVKQILSFSRQRESKPGAIDLHPIIAETLKFLWASLPATITIQSRIVPHLGLVEADATEMHQVVMNLCTNAAQAMGEYGGILTLTLAKVQVEEEIVGFPMTVRPGSYLQLTVQDTGAGMDPETLERIFEPYFTTKEVNLGTGLGLAVVHGIIQSSQGAITVVSKRGQGTAVAVYLPCLEGAAPEESQRETPAPTGREHILLVDDEPDVLAALCSLLTHLGYKAVAVPDSREALARFEASPEAFDLVITDQTMPQLTGLELAAAIHRRKLGVPIILCTGYSDHVTPEKVETAGIAEILKKPTSPAQIAGVIRRALKQAHNNADDLQ